MNLEDEIYRICEQLSSELNLGSQSRLREKDAILTKLKLQHPTAVVMMIYIKQNDCWKYCKKKKKIREVRRGELTLLVFCFVLFAQMILTLSFIFIYFRQKIPQFVHALSSSVNWSIFWLWCWCWEITNRTVAKHQLNFKFQPYMKYVIRQIKNFRWNDGSRNFFLLKYIWISMP